MSSNQLAPLSSLVGAADKIKDQTRADLGGLTGIQLNWKPAPDQWSVAQCLDHLVTTNAAYFSTFDEVLAGEKVGTVWESLPFLPGLWGKMLIKGVAPEAKRKLKAPAIFHPSSSSVDESIVNRFVDQQAQVVGYMNATAGLEPEKIIISSPVTKFVTYSLMDAYRIIINHEQRHLLQAKRVTETNGFPQAVAKL